MQGSYEFWIVVPECVYMLTNSSLSFNKKYVAVSVTWLSTLMPNEKLTGHMKFSGTHWKCMAREFSMRTANLHTSQANLERTML